jgi:ethanolamine permease
MLGLIATMFSLIYSASRQLYAIARDGYLPAVIGRTNARGAPDVTIMLVAGIAILTSFVRAERILLCVVLLLTASYVVLLAAFIRLRQREPHRPRPFRAGGGRGTAAMCMLLALLVLVASFQSDAVALAGLGLFFMVAILVRVLNRGAGSDYPRTGGNLADV